MKASLKNLWEAWIANIAPRAPTEGEAAEFQHRFGGAKLDLLRRALDDYFAGSVPFPKLGGLVEVYGRLQARAAAEAAGADAQEQSRARALVLGGALPRYGFEFQGDDRLTNAVTVRLAFLDWQTAWLDRGLERTDPERVRRREDLEVRLAKLGWPRVAEYEPDRR